MENTENTNEIVWEAPKTNTLTKSEFEKRVKPVFQKMEEILSKSFGPYGSNTIISEYPYSSTTKDGWTIAKNVLFETAIDRTISNMVIDICGRLNNTVGDGTTSAIVATNALYKVYKESEYTDVIKKLPPRDIIKVFKKCSEKIIKVLKERYVMDINPDDENFEETMRNIVAVASNDDEFLTKEIARLYRSLKYPAISIALAPDGVTRTEEIEGYAIDASLLDPIYINNDNKTAVHTNLDIIIFDHRVNANTFTSLIKPLGAQSKVRERHLAVLAPSYDSRALDGVIKETLNAEYRATKDVSIILLNYSARSANDKKKISDFAMLCNTPIISSADEETAIETVKNGGHPFNIDIRAIPKLVVEFFVGNVENSSVGTYKYAPLDRENLAKVKESEKMCPGIRVGYCEKAELGLKKSVFRKFHYDKDLYKAHVAEAEETLKDTINKYRTMGTFNLETAWARERLSALRMKMATIYIGGDSDFSQRMYRDTADDAIKAASSAYQNGVVLGCHLAIREAIGDIFKEEEDTLNDAEKAVLTMLRVAFLDVQSTLLRNKYPDENMILALVLGSSVEKGLFDMVSETYSKNIITSAETDIQILTAVVDLISLLISGNQLVFRHMSETNF